VSGPQQSKDLLTITFYRTQKVGNIQVWSSSMHYVCALSLSLSLSHTHTHTHTHTLQDISGSKMDLQYMYGSSMQTAL